VAVPFASFFALNVMNSSFAPNTMCPAPDADEITAAAAAVATAAVAAASVATTNLFTAAPFGFVRSSTREGARSPSRRTVASSRRMTAR